MTKSAARPTSYAQATHSHDHDKMGYGYVPVRTGSQRYQLLRRRLRTVPYSHDSTASYPTRLRILIIETGIRLRKRMHSSQKYYPGYACSLIRQIGYSYSYIRYR
jgi:hypothetical protein